jgi:hypothetical protein
MQPISQQVSRRKSGFTGALLLLSSPVVRMIRTDDELKQAALDVYDRFHDARLSFTGLSLLTWSRRDVAPARNHSGWASAPEEAISHP